TFGKNQAAFEKLRIAYEAFPDSSHIEHALAHQRIILACETLDEIVAMAHFCEAESVLNRLDSSNVNFYDSYPIITLSEGHVKVLINLEQLQEARIIAKQYYERIAKVKNYKASSR
ncbi:hypothetical protein ACT3TJ_18080, partial [Halomonas sp. AOP30-A1-24]|uniref:hypothetical protein n=1 Tax=Halomonas sp. AOP30-A1-24 TaxID=3457698 RepID=UPI004034D6B2